MKTYALAILLLLAISSVSALSNESIQAKNLLDVARIDIQEMQQRNVPSTRANESYMEAQQLYSAQSLLETRTRSADYSLIIKFASEVGIIKEVAFRSQDELRVFLETYNDSAEKINLSGMDEEYNAVVESFEGERFEDTSGLINIAYEKLSEIESSQTVLNIFYESTTKGIKSFFEDNWITIIIVLASLLVMYIIFKTAISKWIVNRRVHALQIQKSTISQLIKDLQKNYFEEKKISTLEYGIKTKKFEEMIRDIERQIPLLKEEMAKLSKNKKKISKKKK